MEENQGVIVNFLCQLDRAIECQIFDPTLFWMTCEGVSGWD